MHVTLENVTIDNFEVLMDMKLPIEQPRFLASNAYPIAQAATMPTGGHALTPTGFALYDVSGEDE